MDGQSRAPAKVYFLRSFRFPIATCQRSFLSTQGQAFFNKNDMGVFAKYNKFIDYQIQETSLASFAAATDDKKIIKQQNSLTKNEVLSLVETMEFNVPHRPQHLNYFVVCQVGESPKGGVFIPHSPVVVEQVIRNFQAVDKAFKFTEGDGTLFPGPVHEHSTMGWMEGSFHVEGDHKTLTMEWVKNDKLVYQAAIDHTDAYTIDIATPAADDRVNYFSDLYLTSDRAGSAVFGFNFDHLNFMTNNSKFGGLFRNADPRVRASLLAASPILDLSVMRKRVRVHEGENRLQSATEQLAPFIDVQEAPAMVVCSFDMGGSLQRKRAIFVCRRGV